MISQLSLWNAISTGMSGQEISVIALNNSPEDRDLSIPVWQLGVPDGAELKRLMYSNRYGHNVGRVKYQVENGWLELELEGTSAILLACRVGGELSV